MEFRLAIGRQFLVQIQSRRIRPLAVEEQLPRTSPSVTVGNFKKPRSRNRIRACERHQRQIDVLGLDVTSTSVTIHGDRCKLHNALRTKKLMKTRDALQERGLGAPSIRVACGI